MQRGVPAVAADDTEADADEDDVDDRAPKQGLMIPASMGLRFQIPDDLADVHGDCVVGHLRERRDRRGRQAGPPVRHYRRTPVEITETIAVADLDAGRTPTPAR